jgi:PPOX class probable F420-dependent enzyme
MEELLDISTEFGARAQRRLEEEIAAWLTTVGRDGTPQPNPVWFIWEDQTLLIYSKPGQAKLRNIERNPNVAFHLDGDAGGDVVVVTGAATADREALAIDRHPAYVEKYRKDIVRIGYPDAALMAADYSVAIRIVPRKIRGF